MLTATASVRCMTAATAHGTRLTPVPVLVRGTSHTNVRCWATLTYGMSQLAGVIGTAVNAEVAITVLL